jgi:hypothetical protein
MTRLINMLRPLGLTVAALGGLAACGGGGASTPAATPFATLGDTASQQSAALAAASLDTRARATSAQTGTLDRAGDTANIGTLSGAINANRSTIALTAGGTIALQAGANTYSTGYIATPTTGNATIGVLGAVTPTADLPSGSATMTGPATVTIQNDTSLFDLSGDATIAANFSTDRVTTTLSSLDGTQTNGITLAVNVTDVATVTITGSTITGATFNGGTIAVTSATLPSLSASAVTSTNGAFFGPNGNEAGGVFVADDTATGNLRVFGDFIGK